MTQPSTHILRGWTRVFAWILVVLTGLAALMMLLVVTLGAERLAPILGAGFSIRAVRFSINIPTVENPVLLAKQLLVLALGIACFGALRDSRRAASAALVLSLVTAAVEVIVANVGVAPHRLVIPLGAVVYLIFAVGLKPTLAHHDKVAARVPA